MYYIIANFYMYIFVCIVSKFQDCTVTDNACIISQKIQVKTTRQLCGDYAGRTVLNLVFFIIFVWPRDLMDSNNVILY